ncbi:MAG: CehA/McbA family metallohydrolase [Fibrobacteria bacterium]|nr:CehA/McbA family metallohydrolase [Fibrobacteria bacterium]
MKFFLICLIMAIPAFCAPDWKWYTADPHIHAHTCNNQFTPVEDILVEMKKENINIGSILIWGNGGSLQYDFPNFRGQEDDPISEDNWKVRWDVEISGLPGKWHGHMMMLNVAQLDIIDSATGGVNYPGVEYQLPNFKYMHDVEGVLGYSHLQMWHSKYEMPSALCCQPREMPMDVTLTKVDFVGMEGFNDNFMWIWYGMLQGGFMLPIVGDSDYGCIADKIGAYHTAFPIPAGETLSYDKFIDAIRKGRTIARKNNTPPDHLDIRVNEALLGDTLFVDAESDSVTVEIDASSIVSGRQVQLVMNGAVVKSSTITSDLSTYIYKIQIDKSSWLAARISSGANDFSAHTSVVQVLVGGCPVRNDPAGARQWVSYLDKYYAQATAENYTTGKAAELKEKLDLAKAAWEDIALEGEGKKEMNCIEPVAIKQHVGDLREQVMMEFAISRSGLVHFGPQASSQASISIYSIKGDCIAVLSDNTWNGRDQTGVRVPDGLYFARVTYGSKQQVVRFSLVR